MLGIEPSMSNSSIVKPMAASRATVHDAAVQVPGSMLNTSTIKVYPMRGDIEDKVETNVMSVAVVVILSTTTPAKMY